MPSIVIEPASGLQQPGHHAQGRGLAGAVGADQSVEFAAINGEIERVDRGPVEALAQATNRERDGTLGGSRGMHGRSLSKRVVSAA